MRHALLLSILCAVAVGCTDGTSPRRSGPPYLVILPRVSAAPAAALGATVAQYRVRMLSEPSYIDTTVTAAPTDTVILSVDPATYRIELAGLPARCPIREGGEQVAVVAAGASSAIIRYNVTCRLMLTVEMLTQGVEPPPSVRWRLTGPDVDRIRTGPANDTMYFDDIRPGEYEFQVRDLPRRCQVTSAGRDGRRRVTVPETGDLIVRVAVECYDEVARPRIVSTRSSTADGAAALWVRYTDRQFDTDAVEWDLTDCDGRSLLPNGAVTRRGVMAGALLLRDTMEFVTVLETAVAPAALARACSRVRLIDRNGNSSDINETPLQSAEGSRPRFTTFNATLIGFSTIETTFSVDDADNDVAGFVIGYTLRDGALGSPPNGLEDRVFMRSIGYPGTRVPPLEVGTAFLPPATDWRSAFLYVVDRGGNFVFLQDRDLSR